jgi:hypothetical protein
MEFKEIRVSRGRGRKEIRAPKELEQTEPKEPKGNKDIKAGKARAYRDPKEPARVHKEIKAGKDPKEFLMRQAYQICRWNWLSNYQF